MKRFFALSLAALALSACDPLQNFARLQAVEEPVISCPRETGCVFDRNPLRVLPEPVTLPRRPYQFFPLADDLTFVDPRGRVWVAPERTLTDGASIPPIFVSIVGDPTSPSFINAAAVHDAYCGVGNETGVNFHNGTWEDVHKMFYDGLVAGGTPEGTAKVMFAAVWLGGPRWDTLRHLDHVPTPRLQQAMRATAAFIERDDPDLGRLLRYLRWQERMMLQQFPPPHLVAGDGEHSEEPVEYEYEYEYDDGEGSGLEGQ